MAATVSSVFLAALLALSAAAGGAAAAAAAAAGPQATEAEAGKADFPSMVVAAASSRPPCNLPVDAGPCRASIPRWAWGDAAADCVEFAYGGCDGNGNRFASRAECEAACKPGSPLSVEVMPAAVLDAVHATNGSGGAVSGAAALGRVRGPRLPGLLFLASVAIAAAAVSM
ncbi:hypothetical protein Rsub_08596 [Raphidocelis subcapitata]|uniref:BPTI/Kunitz inhibitor domain-containing protein n=1 Tax=Raphidocelis subcapitata TaxID=307507 RepID=A0A2V0P6W5_9CHLO|nr:hypothetical protein Rsub_08596 [Raphidocelis subcapitata]|eukprot:GBF95614.1 hypothetical protein Rsub_08596 [Raphidocelis subcapitata]